MGNAQVFTTPKKKKVEPATGFFRPNAPPSRTPGQVGSRFKLSSQRQRVSGILGTDEQLSRSSLLGS